MEKKAFFKAEGLSAGYGSGDVIHDASFQLEAGTLTGLLGANGSGKTTLIRCVVNQLNHRGFCELEGQRLEDMTVRSLARTVSYIPQRNSLSVSLPVQDVVMMGFNPSLKLLEYPSKAQKQRASEALARVGLAGYGDRDHLTLSEGQKQLVFLARTMIEDTKLLILDEPDSALDVQNRYGILKQLKQMVTTEAGNGPERAGLLCLHDPMLALEFCDQLLLIKDGRCIQQIHPKRDELAVMESALRQIYGPMTLAECSDRKGKRHLVLMYED